MYVTYGVMGILDRIRDPRAAPGVAPPAPPPSRAWLVLVSLLSMDDLAPVRVSVLLLSWRRRGNCSLFMAWFGFGQEFALARWYKRSRRTLFNS